MDYLDLLESEAIYVIRETAEQFSHPTILFSGGKDSACLVHLAQKAFFPVRFPFSLLHIDTGHNFQEAITFRDQVAARTGACLIVKLVQDTINLERAVEPKGPDLSRNAIQSVTLMDAIAELKFDALIGGARRDEEKARAKERFFSYRDEFGQWDPKNQRPELWDLYNGRVQRGDHMRVFPLSNWTEMDVWQYIKRENIQLPPLYFSHKRTVIQKKSGTLLDAHSLNVVNSANQIVDRIVRCRTVGDVTCTGLIESTAVTVDDILSELTFLRTTERGTRTDDQVSESSMEDRKKKGYF